MSELMSSEGFKAREPAVVADFFEAMWRASFFHREALAELSLDLGERYAESSELLEALYADEQLADYDFHPRLSAVSAPTLVVHGDYDTIPRAAAEKIVQALPRSYFVSLGDCGHFPFVDCPDPFFDALSWFYSDPEVER
jgi:pimeloyl-ACP methyl ester carboxylesterase